MAPTALVVGEALIDEYPDERRTAGAPLHVAAHLAALGWHALLVTRLGADTDGRMVLAACDRHGIDTSLVEIDPDHPTGTTAITRDAREHSFEVRFPAAWDLLQGPGTVPRHDALVTGTLPLRHPIGAATVHRLIGVSDGFLAVDANLRPPWVDPTAIAGLIGSTDLLKMNEEEARALGALTASPTWRCVTRGAGGAVLTHRDGRAWSVPGITVPVTDTVGAGDAFLAGLIDGIVRGHEPAEALGAANRIAAATVSRRGGLP